MRVSKFLLFLFSAALFAAPLCASEFGPSRLSADGTRAEGEIVVVTRIPSGANVASVVSAQSAALEAATGAEVVRWTPAIARATGRNIMLLRSGSVDSNELATRARSVGGVVSVSENFVVSASAVPNDEYYPSLWGMQRIRAPRAWDVSTGSANAYVVVIDSGVDYTHPDLVANMGRDSRGNFGRNLWIVDENAEGAGDPMDDNGHGTHVAGTIGAVGNNGIGVAGINWNVKLLAAKVLNSAGRGFVFMTIDALDYILAQKNAGINIKSVNMSLAGWADSYMENPEESAYFIALKAVADAGIVVAVAAGNESQNIDAPEGEYAGKRPYPAAFRMDGMVTVASTTAPGEYGGDELSSFSNWGVGFVHLGAPGSNILSTMPGGGYGNMSGTSMATPHVAGAAALVAAVHPDETSAQIVSRILNGVEQNPNLVGKVATGGHLDLASALGAEPSPVTGVVVEPASVTVGIAGTSQLFARILPADAGNKAVEWRSSAPSVATVSATGIVSGISTGSTTVTARTVEGGFEASCAVSVVPNHVPVESIVVAPAAMSLAVGGTGTFTATVLPATATDKTVVWRSGNPSVATVSASGRVTAVRKGSAAIYAETPDKRVAGRADVQVDGGVAPPSPSTSGGGGCSTGGVSPSVALLLFAFAPALFGGKKR